MRRLFVLAIGLALSGCATIVSKAHYPVSIQSTPNNMAFTVVDDQGTPLHNGTTPDLVNLAAGDGYFQTASYTVQFRDGDTVVKEVPLNARLDGWYFGNILIGGLIGALIVDPISGAMYALPESVVGDMQEDAQLADKEGNLKVMTLDEVPMQYLGKLTPINS